MTLSNKLEGKSTSEKITVFRELSDVSVADAPLLVELLAHENEQMRFWAINSLIKLLPQHVNAHPRDFIPVFTRLLADQSSPVVDRAIWGLNIVGSQAIPYLLNQLNTSNTSLLRLIPFALLRHGNVLDYLTKVITGIAKLLDHSEGAIKQNAKDLLLELMKDKILNHNSSNTDLKGFSISQLNLI